MKKLAVILLLACGCVQVPKSIIKIPGFGEFSLPKDTDIEELDVTAKDGTHFKAKKIKTRTNPEVIGASGMATAEAIDAIGNVVIKGMETGMTSGIGSIVK